MTRRRRDARPIPAATGGAFPISRSTRTRTGFPSCGWSRSVTGRHTLVYQFWVPDGASAAELEATAAYGTQLAEEDIGIVEVVQGNLNVGVYERGPLSPRHENGLFHFHEMVREAVESAGSKRRLTRVSPQRPACRSGQCLAEESQSALA